MQQTKTFILIIISGMLFGCATIQKPTPVSQATNSQVNEKKKEETEKKSSKGIPSSFNLSGAIAVNNKGKGWNASLNWRQQGLSSYTIRLNGPLGGKTVVISKKGNTVTYQEDGKVIKARSDSDLLKKKANINLPVNNLYYWVRGIPAPGSVNYSKKSRDGNMEVIKQHGFTVIYSRYTKNNNGVILPSKIRISGNNVTIKLVIRKWK